jgi:hypothetical protein
MSRDLFAPDFPHSTKEGYAEGCRGAGCPGLIEHGMSCAQVFKRYSGDYHFAKKVDAGMSIGDILAADKEPADNWGSRAIEATRAHELVGRDASGELCSCGARAESLVEHIGGVTLSVIEPPKPVVKPAAPKRERAADGITHGTTSGYAKGCHDGSLCPRGAAGKSCREAYQEYQREYAARRRQNGGKPLAKGGVAEAPKPAPKPTLPSAPVTPIVQADTTALDAAREEIARLTRENADLAERLATLAVPVVVEPEPEVKHAQVTLGDGMTVTINVTVGRAA